jgi:hypothetical protein
MQVLRQQVSHVLWLLALPPMRISHTQLQRHGANTGSAMAVVSCVFVVLFLITTPCNVFHTLMVMR